MIDLKSIDYVRGLKSNFHSTFDTPQGKEVIKFLEESCGWYESVFDVLDKDKILLNAGRREVLATIKTILKLKPDEITRWVKSKE